MLTAINGYYNGFYIVMSENIALQKGQQVIITVDVNDAPTEFVKELRENDRV